MQFVFCVLGRNLLHLYSALSVLLRNSLIDARLCLRLQDGKEFQFSSTVEGSQHVEIFDPIVIKPKRVILPWNPMGDPAQYQLTVSIESGKASVFLNFFDFFSNNLDVR